MAQMVKNLPSMQEIQVQPLGEDALENSMDEGAWWVTIHGLQRVGCD